MKSKETSNHFEFQMSMSMFPRAMNTGDEQS